MRQTKLKLRLTGQYDFRPNFWGALVLWVEKVCVYIDTVDGSYSPEFTIWTRGENRDLKELDLR